MMCDPDSPFYIRPRLDRDLIDWGLEVLRAPPTPRHVGALGPAAARPEPGEPPLL